jgi:hypothetical protein
MDGGECWPLAKRARSMTGSTDRIVVRRRMRRIRRYRSSDGNRFAAAGAGWPEKDAQLRGQYNGQRDERNTTIGR